MLPPGFTPQSTKRYFLLERDAEGTTPTEKQIVSLLQRRGAMIESKLIVATDSVTATVRRTLKALGERGIVHGEPTLAPPQLKSQTVQSAQLAISPDEIEQIMSHLGKESKRANVLEVLLAQPERFIMLDVLLDAAGCKKSVVQALAENGDVLIHPETQFVKSALSYEDIHAVDMPKKWRDALNLLFQDGEPITRPRYDFPDKLYSVLNPLEDAEHIHTWTQPEWVELRLRDEDARQEIVNLRGGTAYLAILHLLSDSQGWLDAESIYTRTGTTVQHLEALHEDGLVALGESEIWRDSLAKRNFNPDIPPLLTPGQQDAWEPIQAHIGGQDRGEAPHTNAFLIHGVTGSGKTEIYMRAVEQVLSLGRQAIVLVPEIALTAQMVQRFARRFPGKIALIHSSLSHGERYDTWRRIRAGQVEVVLGARSALFAPLPDVGLIVLDEEHDDSYKQSPPVNPPYYHARETAIEYMRRNHGTVILGSATPDVVSYYHALRENIRLLRLPDRVLAHREHMVQQTRELHIQEPHYETLAGLEAAVLPLPEVRVVDMRHELRVGHISVFSRALIAEVHTVLAKGQQALLFLNRRGMSTYVFCSDCGYIAKCPRCDTPLTYHTAGEKLTCHHCGHQEDNPTRCPACASRRIKYFGRGTEQIEKVLREEFPEARVLRWDRDTAAKHDAHTAIFEAFAAHQADVLVGTQMITKGLDLPLVTLVGIISADTALGLPDYRTGENTFQILTQVAGRAGRSPLGGRVILQTYQPHHYAIRAAAAHDYETFYEREIEYRRSLHYPPFVRLVRLLFRDRIAHRAMQEAERVAALVDERIKTGKFTASERIGPVPCFFKKIDNQYRYQILVRTQNPTTLLEDIDIGYQCALDIDPLDIL